MKIKSNQIIKSRIVASAAESKKYYMLDKCLGIFCIPFCCMGVLLLKELREDTRDEKYLFKIVKLYGEKVLNDLRPLVEYEHQLFLKACHHVNKNALQDDVNIFPNVILLDAIEAVLPTVGIVLNYPRRETTYCQSKQTSESEKEKKKNMYLLDVYNKYIDLGGNITNVVYGLPEYLAIMNDTLSFTMIDYYKQLLRSTQLYELVMSYKPGTTNNTIEGQKGQGQVK